MALLPVHPLGSLPHEYGDLHLEGRRQAGEVHPHVGQSGLPARAASAAGHLGVEEGARAAHGPLGAHRTARPTAGALVRRAGPLERAVARVCREGACITTNVFLRDLNLGMPLSDERGLEVVANWLPTLGGAQVAVDATFVSPVRRDGTPSPASPCRRQQAASAGAPARSSRARRGAASLSSPSSLGGVWGTRPRRSCNALHGARPRPAPKPSAENCRRLRAPVGAVAGGRGAGRSRGQPQLASYRCWRRRCPGAAAGRRHVQHPLGAGRVRAMVFHRSWTQKGVCQKAHLLDACALFSVQAGWPSHT